MRSKIEISNRCAVCLAEEAEDAYTENSYGIRGRLKMPTPKRATASE